MICEVVGIFGACFNFLNEKKKILFLQLCTASNGLIECFEIIGSLFCVYCASARPTGVRRLHSPHLHIFGCWLGAPSETASSLYRHTQGTTKRP